VEKTIARLMRRRKKEWLLIPLLFMCFYVLFRFSPKQQKNSLQSSPDGFFYYEVQKQYLKYTRESTIYQIAIVADKDKSSKNSKGFWESILKKGTLTRDILTGRYSVKWGEEISLSSKLSEDGRAMELSELIWFNDKLLAPDDRTGVVFSIEGGVAIPQFILMDGNGSTTKGFKIEWGTVKDGILYLGSIGKEWSDSQGNLINNNPQWVKLIDKNGKIEHRDWSMFYEQMRKATGAQHPGYLMHEAGAWNPLLRKWFFLPRRYSTEMYNDAEDEKRGTNHMIVADENFEHINVTRIGPLTATRGFSSIVFVPGREFEVIALKSEEFGEKIASYITVLNVLTGEVLMEEEYIQSMKFEGIEIL